MSKLLKRFMEHIEKTDDCWLWNGRMSPQGYGNFRVDGKSMGVHRLSYELFVGEIPKGRVVDHTCHNNSSCSGGWGCLHRRCVNPDHLEAVTQRENLRRSNRTNVEPLYCMKGLHRFEGDNIVTGPGGHRRCRPCTADKNRRWQQKKKEKNAIVNTN